MNKLLVPVFIAALGFVFYKSIFASSAAYEGYVRFADALLFDRWDEARGLTTGPKAQGILDDYETQRAAIGREAYRMITGTVHMGPYRTLESETVLADGKVELRVVQEERRGAVAMAPVGPPNVRHKHRAVMMETAAGWRVDEFEEQTEWLGNAPRGPQLDK